MTNYKVLENHLVEEPLSRIIKIFNGYSGVVLWQ